MQFTSSRTAMACTAHGKEGDKVRNLDTGADHYLVKPHLISELLARIRIVDIHVGRPHKALKQDGESDPVRTVRSAGHSPDVTP